MAGEQLGSTRSKLTRLSGYLLDFSKPGRLFLSGHRYTAREWLDRFVIVGASLGAFYAGYHYAPEWLMLSKVAFGTACSLSAFMITHTIATLPLLKKRVGMVQKARKYKEEIGDLLQQQYGTHVSDELTQRINSVVQKIESQTCEHEGIGGASKTLGKQTRRLHNLFNFLKSEFNDTSENAADNASSQGFLNYLRETPPELIVKHLDLVEKDRCVYSHKRR